MNVVLPRIAIISTSCPPLSRGGVAAAQYHLFLALRNKGYPTELFTFNDEKRDIQDPCFIHRFGCPKWIKKLLARLTRLYFKFKEPGTLTYQYYDIISCQWGAWKCRNALKAFTPDIVILPDRGCPGLGIGKIAKEKTLMICHHNSARFNNPLLYNVPYSEKDIFEAVKLEKKALRYVDAVICPSQYMANFLQNSHNYMGKLYVIPNILETNQLDTVTPISVAEKLYKDKKSPIVYIPSGGSTIKGSRYTFEIIRRLNHINPDIGFYISGPIDPLIMHELETAKLASHVYWVGHLNYHENMSHVASCTLCISPTLAESFGMALFEAQYLGIPVIAFDVGGNKDVILDGQSGYLLPQLDIEGIIEKASYLLQERQQNLFYRMSKKAQAHAHSLVGNSGIDNYCKIINDIFME